MGDFDYVKVVLDRMGDMRWMQVAIKPAKPLAFGTVLWGDGRRVPVLGLPGNPVSSLVSFELFGRPALRRLAGHPEAAWVPEPVRATAGEPLPRRADGKVHFVRVRCDTAPDGRLTVRPSGGQGSHQLAAMAAAQGLAVLPDGPGLDAGDPVEVLRLPA
jgi:molybdopterin molybdotransferase